MSAPASPPTVDLSKHEEPAKPGLGERFAALRRRWPWLNHLINAFQFFQSRQSDLLAGSITYFSFLALFPLLLLGVSVAGYVLAGRPDLLQELVDAIRENVPGDFGDQIVDSLDGVINNPGAIGVVGLIGFLYAGLGWMGKLRLSMQMLWLGEPIQVNFLKAYLLDFIALIGIGGAIVLSVGVTALANGLTGTFLDLLHLDDLPGAGVVTRILGILVSIAGTSVIFLWLFIRLPQLHISVRNVLPGALFAAAGFEVLKLVGALYLASVSQSPAAVAFGSIIGVLVWIYLVSRFLLFAAAWTATLPRVVEERRGDLVAEGSDALLQGPQLPPLRVAGGTPSTGAVVAGLVGVGAVVGTGATVAARRWWRAGRAAARRR